MLNTETELQTENTTLAGLVELHTLAFAAAAPHSSNPELVLDFAAPQAHDAMDMSMRTAKKPAPILIMGESGTGKSIVARSIHEHSHVTPKPFITVSCSGISQALLVSELFGHVKGTLTGAVQDKWGKVKAASGGTLFLHEIGDLPMELQPNLLRLLEKHEYERLGENVTRPADIRVIATTSRDLKKSITKGVFREDLYVRLSTVAVEMPPLRQQGSDLLRFAEHYLKHFSAKWRRSIHGFSDQAVAQIRNYSWPGNIREMCNAIESAVILAKDDTINTEDLPMDMRTAHHANGSMARAGDLISLKQLKEIHIRKVLERTSSINQAARILGIHPASIYRQCKKLKMQWQ